jgi:hypothetical protein
VKEIERRITRLEAYRQIRDGANHFVSVLFYPWALPDDQRDAWVAEQLACPCTPDCPGKSGGALLPEKAPSPEAWEERVRAYQAQRRGTP